MTFNYNSLADSLSPENRAQITKDNPSYMSFELNHISPCISSEENSENHAQNELLRRSGDTGDICSSSSSLQTHGTKILSNELHDESTNSNDDTIIPNPPVLLQPLPKVKKVLDRYLTFDFEWDINTHVIEAASFVDSLGNSRVLLRSDFDNYSERAFKVH